MATYKNYEIDTQNEMYIDYLNESVDFDGQLNREIAARFETMKNVLNWILETYCTDEIQNSMEVPDFCVIAAGGLCGLDLTKAQKV